MRKSLATSVSMHQNQFLLKLFDEDGLKESLKRYLTVVTSSQVVNFYQLVQAAMKIEKSEMVSPERNRERKFSRGHSSSGTYRRITEGCFLCGSTYHLIINCPRGSGTSRNPQGSCRGGSNVPLLTRDKGKG